MLQSSEVKILTAGILTISCLTYYFNRFSQQQKNYKQKLQQFKMTYEESQKKKDTSLDAFSMFKENTKQPVKEKLFCFNNVRAQYNESTFKLYERQRSIFFRYPKYNSQSVLQHQMGGHFMFKSHHARIKCQLNDFNLSGDLLRQTQKTPVHLFKGINQIQPIVQSVVTRMVLPLVSIYGKLYYDDNQLQWTIEPFFVTGKVQLKSFIEHYYKDKSSEASLWKFAIFIGSFVIGYFTLIKPIKEIYHKYFNYPKRINLPDANDLQYFKNKDYLMVKKESLLNCEKCKQKSVEMVYECGHLGLCVDCHEQNAEKLCPLCGKKSTRFMKIFMA